MDTQETSVYPTRPLGYHSSQGQVVHICDGSEISGVFSMKCIFYRHFKISCELSIDIILFNLL